MLNNKSLWLLGVILFCLLAVTAVGTFQNKRETTAYAAGQSQAIISGELLKWHPVTLDFPGPMANETDDSPNPFLDYRLNVTFTGPQGQNYDVPGFFAGDGQGNGSGNIWRVIFAPDSAGIWQYSAAFHSGTDIAVDLDLANGTPHSFHGESGTFDISYPTCEPSGFLAQGRLEYVGAHYLKFADGEYWLKGGVDSPENFLAYSGFDNTVDQGGPIPNFLHHYAPHIADWNPGDPNFVSADTGNDGKGIIGALNYLSEQGINSIYFLPMNLGGDGQEVYPFINPGNNAYDKTHYDISKLDQWSIVFNHAQNKGIALQFVLAETEFDNMTWLDFGGLGVQRKLFYRELIARYGHLLAIKWNLSEENNYSINQLNMFAEYIHALDWNEHQLAVHTHLDNFSDYEQLLGDDKFTNTSIQYTSDMANFIVDSWRVQSANASQFWVLDMDENYTSLTSWNEDDLRVEVLYPVYFSGGNIEWYLGYHNLPLGGDLRLEDFRTREKMWRYTRYARHFIEEYLPFWEMTSQDDLLNGENISRGPGQVFAKPNEIYTVYLPIADGTGQLNLTGTSGLYSLRWFDPRNGVFVGSPQTLLAGSVISLGTPPTDSDMDWVILIDRVEQAGVNGRFAGGSSVYLPMIASSCPAIPTP